MPTDNVTRWYTESIFIDIDTGEVITSENAKRNYIIIKKHKKTEINGKTAIIQWTNECQRSGQLEIKF